MMPGAEFRTEALDAAKDRRSEFCCESQALTDYLRHQARKEMAAKASACFVLVPVSDPGRIAGYYTLSAASVALVRLPVELSRRLPKYPDVPAILLGRLARDLAFKGKGVGPILMRDALERAWKHSAEIGTVVIVTDPKEAKAAAFYSQYGFRRLDEKRMFVSMQEVERWLTELAND